VKTLIILSSRIVVLDVGFIFVKRLISCRIRRRRRSLLVVLKGSAYWNIILISCWKSYQMPICVISINLSIGILIIEHKSLVIYLYYIYFINNIIINPSNIILFIIIILQILNIYKWKLWEIKKNQYHM
jgi:hypothetical protein